jgi:hypothetical protein
MINRLLDWLDDNSPVWCARCGKMLRHKNARLEWTTLGRLVPICPEFHKTLYHPYEE